MVVTGPKKTGAKSLPNGVAMPYSVLSAEPVSLTDINLVSKPLTRFSGMETRFI